MAVVTHEVEYVGGSPEVTRGTWLWVGAGAVALVLVMFMQWFSVDTRSQTTATAPASARQNEAVEWGSYSPFALEAKETLKFARAAGRSADDDEGEDGEPVTVQDKFKEKIEPLAVTRAERLRLAIVAGEIFGKDEALNRLEALKSELEQGSALAADAEWLRRLYADGADSVPRDAQQALLDRHEWFGQLALSFGKPMTDKYRRQALEGRKRIELAYMRVFGLYAIMFLGGIGLLIWAGWLIGGGTIAFNNAPGGNPDEYLQTFVLFCIAFVVVGGLALVPFGMDAEGSIGAQIFHDILSWVLPFVLIWPLARGVQFSNFRREVGWTIGGPAGLIKEIAIGAMAQIAWTPLLLIISIVLGLIQGLLSSGERGVGGYPMFQHPPIEHPVVLFIQITSLVIWAPLVEETIFRGLLYGWLRQRLSFRWSLLISSAIFGMVHPYSPLGMVQVAFGGLLFGMLREWRGSLVAPMVAHAINNGVIALVSFTLARAIGA